MPTTPVASKSPEYEPAKEAGPSPEPPNKVGEEEMAEVKPMDITEEDKGRIIVEMIDKGTAISPEIEIVKNLKVRFKLLSVGDTQQIEKKTEKLNEETFVYAVREIALWNLAYALTKYGTKEIPADMKDRKDFLSNKPSIFINKLRDAYISWEGAVTLLLKGDVIKNV